MDNLRQDWINMTSTSSRPLFDSFPAFSQTSQYVPRINISDWSLNYTNAMNTMEEDFRYIGDSGYRYMQEGIRLAEYEKELLLHDMEKMGWDRVFTGMMGALLILACVITTMSTLKQHARNFVAPAMQICCVRIILLAPVCAMLCWLALVFGGKASVFLDSSRACYEAFAVYSFLGLVLSYVGGPTRCSDLLVDAPYPGLQCTPCPLLQCCTMYTFKSPITRVHFWQFSVGQLLLLKPITAGVLSYMNFQEELGMPVDGFAWLGFWARTFNVISSGLAMNTLLEAYMSLKPHLSGLQPVQKFLVMKILIGLLLVQELLIDSVRNEGSEMQTVRGLTLDKIVEEAHALTVMVEMLGISIMFRSAFSVEPFRKKKVNLSNHTEKQDLDLVWLSDVVTSDVYSDPDDTMEDEMSMDIQASPSRLSTTGAGLEEPGVVSGQFAHRVHSPTSLNRTSSRSFRDTYETEKQLRM